MKELYFHLLAPAAAISFLWLLIAVLFSFRDLPRERLFRAGIAIFAGSTVAAAIFLACPPNFRVLYDETAFLNSAQALLSTGLPSRSQEWLWSGGELVPLEELPPFRPALFPLLIALSGLIDGPAIWHGFFVSFLATALTFALLIASSKSAREAALSCAYVAGSAVFCFTAASSGYDLLSLSLGFLTCRLLLRVETDGSNEALGAVLGAALCFAHTRNEGILAFLIVWAWLAFRRRRSMTKQSFALLLLAPFLLVPLIAQRIAFYPHVELRGLGDLFSVAHIPGHSLDLLKAFFIEPLGPFPVLPHWLGAWFLFRNRNRLLSSSYLPCCLFLAALLFLLLAFHEGGVKHPFQARLYLPFSFVLCIWAGTAWNANKLWRGAALTAAIAQLVLSIPHLQQGYLYFRHQLIDEAIAVRALVEKSPPMAVFVYFSSGMAAAFGRASVRPKTFERERAAISEKLKREAAGPVYLVESWPPHPGTVTSTLKDSEIRFLEEIHLPGLRYLRVLELTSPGELPAPEPVSPQRR